jgi:hypothetical protein
MSGSGRWNEAQRKDPFSPIIQDHDQYQSKYEQADANRVLPAVAKN